MSAGENLSVKIEGREGVRSALYIVKIEKFYPVLTSSLSGTRNFPNSKPKSCPGFSTTKCLLDFYT